MLLCCKHSAFRFEPDPIGGRGLGGMGLGGLVQALQRGLRRKFIGLGPALRAADGGVA